MPRRLKRSPSSATGLKSSKKTSKIGIAFFLAMIFLYSSGCKNQAAEPANAAVAQAAITNLTEPPAIDAGISVEQAYEAIPHRRTIWIESESAVPTEEKKYLSVMFQVLDEAIAVRVAGLQNYSSQKFNEVDIDAQFDQLISFVRAVQAPKTLAIYHQHILDGLAGEQRFFADWKREGDRFAYAQQIQGHPGVRSASTAVRAAYAELMSKYPSESARNKEAFFDYHCALDFL